MTSTPETGRRLVFVSYSHADGTWLQRLKTHLKPLERQGALEVWDDRRIQAGAKWREEIRVALGRARVAVLLVSPDFLASDYIAQHELPELLGAERELRIIWVPLRPSNFAATEVGEYQAAFDPRRTLAEMSDAEADRTLVAVSEKIVQAYRDAPSNDARPLVTAGSAPAPAPARRSRLPLVLVAAALAGLAGVGAWSALQWQPRAVQPPAPDEPEVEPRPPSGQQPAAIVPRNPPQPREQKREQGPEKALEYYQQALSLRRQVGDVPGEAATLSSIGRVYEASGEKKKALETFQQALSLWSRLENAPESAAAHNDVARVYGATGEREKALEHDLLALQLWKALGDARGEARTLNSIGVTCRALGRKRTALEYHQQALPLWRQVGDVSEEATTLSNIGDVYFAMGDRKKAAVHYLQALPLRQRQKDVPGEAATLRALGLAYHHLGNGKKALEYYEQELRIRQQAGNASRIAAILNRMGDVHLVSGDDRRALEHYTLALQHAQRAGNALEEAVTLKRLGDVSFLMGDRRKALEQYRMAQSLWSRTGNQGRSLALELAGDIALLAKDTDRSEAERIEAERALEAVASAGRPKLDIYLSLVVDERSGPSPELTRVAEELLRSHIQTMGGVVAPRGQSDFAAFTVIKRQRLAGYMLRLALEVTAPGALRVNLVCYTYPGRSLLGEVNVKASGNGLEEARLRAAIPKVLEEAAETLSWTWGPWSS